MTLLPFILFVLLFYLLIRINLMSVAKRTYPNFLSGAMWEQSLGKEWSLTSFSSCSVSQEQQL